jgi:hypothetical protein
VLGSCKAKHDHVIDIKYVKEVAVIFGRSKQIVDSASKERKADLAVGRETLCMYEICTPSNSLLSARLAQVNNRPLCNPQA